MELGRQEQLLMAACTRSVKPTIQQIPPDDRKRSLKRGPFTHARVMDAGDNQDVHVEPVIGGISDTGDASTESGTDEFYDFFDFPEDGHAFNEARAAQELGKELEFQTPSGTNCRTEDLTAGLKETDSLTEFLLDPEALSSETQTSLEDIPQSSCGSQDTILGPGKPTNRLPKPGTNSFTPQNKIGLEAMKYWPSPSLPEAFHLSEAIIKFTRDVEAAKNSFP